MRGPKYAATGAAVAAVLAALILGVTYSYYCWISAVVEAQHTKIHRLTGDLAILEARLSDRETAADMLGRLLADFEKEIQAIAECPDASKKRSERAQARPTELGNASFVLQALTGLAETPDPEAIEALGPLEENELLSAWAGLPQEASQALSQLADTPVLDIDAVIADSRLNPEGRQPSLEERIELATAHRNLYYFRHVSPRETLYTVVLPAAEEKRAIGDYVEYEGTPPRLPPGVRISHAEDTSTPGVSRMYFFFPEENPLLYHHWRVERQQVLLAMLRIYEVFNRER